MVRTCVPHNTVREGTEARTAWLVQRVAEYRHGSAAFRPCFWVSVVVFVRTAGTALTVRVRFEGGGYARGGGGGGGVPREGEGEWRYSFGTVLCTRGA